MSSQQLILCTLIYSQCKRRKVGKEQEGLRCHETAGGKASRLYIPLPSKGGALFTYQKQMPGVTELQRFGCGSGWSESRSQPGIPGSPRLPEPIPQAARSLSLLDLWAAQLSFTARSGIYHHQPSPRLFSW